MRAHASLALTAVGALWGATAEAAIRPAFSAADSAFRATHVVVVDKTGKVVESWKGDLKPGDLLPLDKFDVPLEHGVDRRRGLRRQPDDEQAGPDRVTGPRLVRFLRKGGGPGKYRTFDHGWRPTHWYSEEFRDSTAWIEGGRVFGLAQFFNPGPQVMTEVAAIEQAFKAEVLLHTTTRDRYDAALADPDLARRAAALEPLVAGRMSWVRDEVIRQLGFCGPAGLPALRMIAADPDRRDEHRAALDAMGVIGPPAAADLLAVVREELEYWKKVEPTLPADWDRGLDPDKDHTYHWGRLCRALQWGTAFVGRSQADLKVLQDVSDLFHSPRVLGKDAATTSPHPGRLALDAKGRAYEWSRYRDR